MSKQHITTTINGNEVEFLCETPQSLLDVLRNELGMTGTKIIEAVLDAARELRGA